MTSSVKYLTTDFSLEVWIPGVIEGDDMTLFRLDASTRVRGSASREIADIVEAEWLSVHPGETVERRHIGVDVLPSDAWPHAVGAMYVPESDRTPEQSSAVVLAAALVDELHRAGRRLWGRHAARRLGSLD